MKKVLLTLLFGLFFVAFSNAQSTDKKETKAKVEYTVKKDAKSASTPACCAGKKDCSAKDKAACDGKAKASCGSGKAKAASCDGKDKAACASKAKASCGSGKAKAKASCGGGKCGGGK